MTKGHSPVSRSNQSVRTPVPPLARFLTHCHQAFRAENGGTVATYIPELGKADPSLFGIALATCDGRVYAAGDCDVAFTIQSISKAFVFGLAVDMCGADVVEQTVGVEPSGEAFNSIRLRVDNRPFNPMVNAGAIACSGLIYRKVEGDADDFILAALGRFAGRDLAVDESVFASERATGDRNRAIAYLLRNYGVVKDGVAPVLDVYFRQCSILVTARDLAVMAATLANSGVNPITGERVISPEAVTRTLSVMTTSGMYDFAGEWMYRIGIPAKSGVGGGIIASLPTQFGMGTFSPALDEHGNSVRGVLVCEEVSRTFSLHVLDRSGDVRTCLIAKYQIDHMPSRRMRQPHEQRILEANATGIHVLELTGALSFANVDYISNQIAIDRSSPVFVVFDLSRVPMMSRAAATLFGELVAELSGAGVTTVLSGVKAGSPLADVINGVATDTLRWFVKLDEAIEWSEDQLIFRYGGFTDLSECPDLSQQTLLADLSPPELRAVTELTVPRAYRTGERIIAAGTPADSVFFLESGMVSVKLGNGMRIASLVPGMAFGEMALLDAPRIADVWADTPVRCRELPIEQIDIVRGAHPTLGERIMRNLAALLAGRLAQANRRVELLRGTSGA